MRTSEEIKAEIEDIREGLIELLNSSYSLEFIDLLFIAKQVEDLKTELRLAKANE